MPGWKIGFGLFIVVSGSVTGLLISLAPELQLARHDRTRQVAWIPSMLLQSFVGVALGVVASVQRARGLPVRGQTALGAFSVALLAWMFLSALLGQFDRTRREARQVFRACLALAFGFLVGMFLVGPLLSSREAAPNMSQLLTPFILVAIEVEVPQNNALTLTKEAGASRPAGFINSLFAGHSGVMATLGEGTQA